MSYTFQFFGLVALTALVAGFFWTLGCYICAKVFK